MARLGRTEVICGYLLLDLAAGRLDLGPRRRGKSDTPDRVGPVGVAGAQQLHRGVRLPDEAGRIQRFRAHVGGTHLLEVGQVDDLGLDPERVGEATLGEAAVHRHLPALEAGVGAAPGAGLVTLVALAGGLAEPGARPTAAAV